MLNLICVGELEKAMAVKRYFYDGMCPLCQWEVDRLKAHDKEQRITFIDVHQDDFSECYPHIDQDDAYKSVHAELDSGDILKGTDVTHAVWSQVAFERVVAPLKWPLFRIFFRVLYFFVARYRYVVSRIFTGNYKYNKK